jgi:hypothetical protein
VVRQRTIELLEHLSTKPGHDEVKADFRQLLIEEFGAKLGELDFERRVPEVRGRLDALIGRTVFEAKSDLLAEWPDVVRRMPDYLKDREREEQTAFIGIGSDGLQWSVFELSGDSLVEIKKATLNPDRPEEFLAWLEGAVALRSELPPEPLTIRSELGRESVAYRRAFVALRDLWGDLRTDPAVALKRQLWSQLLKLVYGREVESDELWFQHTFLVVIAKAIALAVLELREEDPKRLLSGRAFEAAGIMGAVESDFFDWVVAVPEGEELVRKLVNHVRRFRLRDVNSDVLKVLYEGLIDREERHGLGEYYTPDWLAAKVVRQAVERPLEQRVLDPACGSGTFLFHAIRRFLEEAEAGDIPRMDRAREAASKVTGMDIHPVAVIIARVTYLLALAPILTSRSGTISIPVYLGDALQLSISDVMGLRELQVRVPPLPEAPKGTKPEVLSFPDVFCKDPTLFDKAIEALRTGSEADLTRRQVEQRLIREVQLLYKREPTREELDAVTDLGATYVTFDSLRRKGRDSVWAYVARNLSRPLALSANGGWANVLVGNPPWVAYRYLSSDMKTRVKALATGERVYVGRVPSQNDLCALFVVRTTGLYLRPGGRLAFVLPLAALTRGQFEKLRGGSFTSARVAWDQAWTLGDDVSPLFPVPSAVLFGLRRANAVATPSLVTAFSGRLPMRDAPEAIADQCLTRAINAPAPEEAVSSGGSPYRAQFRNGATLFPRVLCFVTRGVVGRLGGDETAPLVISRRSRQEKPPWRSLPSIEHRVEAEFLRVVLMGESIVPYRVLRPLEAVIPMDANGKMLSSSAAATLGMAGLHAWMSEAESLWNSNKRSKMSLVEMLDYYGQLTAQAKEHRFRVAYAKAGSLLAATVVREPRAVIENSLYWAPATTTDEAHYLTAILNSEVTRSRIVGLQSRGQWGARHFDKVVFALKIPLFDAGVSLHRQLAESASRCEEIVATMVISDAVGFQRARQIVRRRLHEEGLASQIDGLVAALLD